MQAAAAEAAPAATPVSLAARIQDIVLARIAADKLIVPLMPVTAEKAAKLLREPEITTKKLSALLEFDPPMAAKVARLGHASGPGKNLEQYVTRLGPGKVKSLLVEASAYKPFESQDTNIGSAYNKLQTHCRAVALLARDLAALGQGGVDPDEAFVTGLLHDVGKIVMAAILLEAERMLGRSSNQGWMTADEWLKIIDKGHQTVSIALGEKWRLPEAVLQVMMEPNDYDPVSRHSAGNYVRFADALVNREGFYVGEANLDDAEALIMVGRSLLGADDDLITRMLTNLRERLRAKTD